MERLVCGIVLLLSAVCFAHPHNEHKNGSCPLVALPQSNSTFTDSNSTNMRVHVPDECYMDSSCPFSHKCCNSSDGVFRCTHPIFQPTTTAATTDVVKEGRCPFPLPFGSAIECNDSYTCTTDSDCYSSQKCCPRFTGQDCSICRSPVFDYNHTTKKPYRYQPGICPENFNRYYEYGYYRNDNCPNHCNETRDCDEGELCCVPEVEPPIYYDVPEWKRHAEHQSNTPGCPVCKTADLSCRTEYGVYYQDKEVYKSSSDECRLCQCFEGYPRCYQVCDQDSYHWHRGGRWFAAGILSAVSLLISVIFSLFLCCCMKLCCNGKKNTIVVPQPPAVQVQAQPPPQYYYMAPATEDKIPLTDDGVSTA